MATFSTPANHPVAADKAPGAPVDENEHPDHHNAVAADLNSVVDYLESEFATSGPLQESDIGTTVQAHSAVLDATTASFLTADETKLDGIESGATADQSDAEIETAYNNQVSAASQAEMEAGTETAIRRMSPLRVAQAISALGGGGGSDTPWTENHDAGDYALTNLEQVAIRNADASPAISVDYNSDTIAAPYVGLQMSGTLNLAGNNYQGLVVSPGLGTNASITAVTGFYFLPSVTSSSASTITTMSAVIAQPQVGPATTATTMRAFHAYCNAIFGTITTAVGLDVQSGNKLGTFTTMVGVRITNLSGTITNKWGLQVGDYGSYHQGPFAFGGTTMPVHAIELQGTGGDDGSIQFAEQASTPTSPTSGSEMNVYMKADKFVIQYNDGGTVRYKYLLLSGTGTTWTHTTTAP